MMPRRRSAILSLYYEDFTPGTEHVTRGRTITESDITRFAGHTPPPRHLSFSGGLHFCLGAQLGRLESAIAIDTLLRRAPGLSLTDEPVWRDTVAIHGLETLPVRLRD